MSFPSDFPARLATELSRHDKATLDTPVCLLSKGRLESTLGELVRETGWEGSVGDYINAEGLAGWSKPLLQQIADLVARICAGDS